MKKLIADAGFLVAAGRRSDPRHLGAVAFSAQFSGQLVTTSAVIIETCHFVNAEARINLLNSVGPRLAVVEVPVLSYPDLAATIGKYADREVDFADASLVWLAERSGLRQILTVDVADFSTFRLSGGKRFDLIDWS
ncbi:MAG: PIN domain-containing protein [Betaproteobacteria bacterium]